MESPSHLKQIRTSTNGMRKWQNWFWIIPVTTVKCTFTSWKIMYFRTHALQMQLLKIDGYGQGGMPLVASWRYWTQPSNFAQCSARALTWKDLGKVNVQDELQDVFACSQLILTTLFFGSLRPSDALSEKLCVCKRRIRVNRFDWRKTTEVGWAQPRYAPPDGACVIINDYEVCDII